MSEDYRLERANWHVVTKTRSGVVSLVRNLPLALAVNMSTQLKPPRQVGVPYTVHDGDIDEIHILGPEEWDGCRRAMKHDRENIRKMVITDGPDAGRTYVSATCGCGAYLAHWDDNGEPA